MTASSTWYSTWVLARQHFDPGDLTNESTMHTLICFHFSTCPVSYFVRPTAVRQLECHSRFIKKQAAVLRKQQQAISLHVTPVGPTATVVGTVAMTGQG